MRYFAIFLFFLAGLGPATAATTALIVVGLTADEKDTTLWRVTADEIRAGLVARGVAAPNITILSADGGSPVTRDGLLAAMAKIQTASGKDGECWVVLLGHSAPGRDGAPAFQLRGPRLTAGDLHDALAGFTGPTYVLLGTELSTDYLTLLKTLPHCTAVAASNGPMTPRFTGFWADELSANPKATFAQLAFAAAAHVATYYKDGGLAQSENASLLAGQDIYEAPFADLPGAAPAATTAPRGQRGVRRHFPAGHRRETWRGLGFVTQSVEAAAHRRKLPIANSSGTANRSCCPSAGKPGLES